MRLGFLPIPRHDDGEGFLCTTDLPRRRVRYLNSLLTEARIGSLMLQMTMRCMMDVLLSAL